MKKDVVVNYNLSEFFTLLKLKWKFLIIVNICALIILIIISFALPNKFDCRVTILPPEETTPANLGNFLQNFSMFPLYPTSKGFKSQIYLEILRSNELVRFLAKQDSIRNLPVFKSLDSLKIQKILQNSINVDLKQSGLLIFNVSFSTTFFSSKTQKQNVAFASAFVAKKTLEGLDTLLRSRLTSKARKKRQLIENTLELKRRELDSIEDELQAFREQNKLLSLDEQSQAVLTSAISTGSELAKAEIELQLALTEYEPSSPLIQALKEKVQTLRNQYNRIQGGGLLGTESFAIPLKNLPSLVRKFTALMRDQKILEQVTVFLETQKYQESIQEQTEISSIDVLDQPIIPKEPSSPRKSVFVAIGLIISIIISLSYLFIKSLRRNGEQMNLENQFL
ncbi:MAG: GNVR domain-containing protein [Candidatus Kapaibacteriales bacterium]